VERFERQVILSELKEGGFRVTRAREEAGLERSHLDQKAK